MRKTLLVRGSGGLSNRLQAVIAGVAYCLLSGRCLCVDWRDGMYSDDFSNVFPLWFQIEGLPSLEKVPAWPADAQGGLYPPFWHDWLNDAVAVEYLFNNDHLEPKNVALTSIDFTHTEYAESLLVGWAADLQPALALAPALRNAAVRLQKPFLAQYTDREIVRWLAQTYIRLQPHLQSRVDAFAAKHFTRARTIGIHIRYTDLQSPLEAMLDCLRSIATDACTIFVATDNKHVQATVCRLFPQAVCTPKVFPVGDEPLHCFVPELSNVQKGEEALVDMYLLSRCDELVYFSQSSFSRIPLLLAQLPDENIHAL